MSNSFNNDYEERYLTSGNNDSYEEPEELEAEEKNEETDEYYELPLAIKSRTLLWAVLSLFAGIFSILLCPWYYVCFVMSACSAIFSLISRSNLGFFEKYSIMGLVLGLMGFVCGVFAFVANLIGLFG